MIVHGISPDVGRFSVMARGAKGSRRRFVGRLAVFNELEMRLGGAGNLPTLTEVSLIASFPGLSLDYQRFCRVSYLAETAEAVHSHDRHVGRNVSLRSLKFAFPRDAPPKKAGTAPQIVDLSR